MNVMTLDLSGQIRSEFDRREILRYAGCKSAEDSVMELMEGCIAETKDIFSARVCYAEVPLNIDGETVDMGFAKAHSRALAKTLTGCDGAIVFGATVGIGIDRLIARYGRLSPARAVILQAIGAERIEDLCDAFCNVMKQKYGDMRPRFSPGYGDLTLEIQRDIFSLLDCPRRIGLTLNESLLMSPTKSVTAIVGKR